jgi:hypothetical protein
MSERCEQCNHLWQMHDRIAKGTGCQEPTGSWQECGCMKLKPSPAGTPLEGTVEHPVAYSRIQVDAEKFDRAISAAAKSVQLMEDASMAADEPLPALASEVHILLLWMREIAVNREVALPLAGCVKDATNPCGWRNKRAEEAEAELESLKETVASLGITSREYASHLGPAMMWQNSLWQAAQSELDEANAKIAMLESSSVPQDADKWISVNERLPDERCKVLAYFEDGERRISHWFKWETMDTPMWHPGIKDFGSVTHWQPLPAAPLNLEQPTESSSVPQDAASGISLIAEERHRQITVKRWSPEHDEAHDNGEIAMAAQAYIDGARKASHGIEMPYMMSPPAAWPWDWTWWKPSKRPIRNLVKAGALIAAEIDRLQRVAPPLNLEQPTESSSTPQDAVIATVKAIMAEIEEWDEPMTHKEIYKVINNIFPAAPYLEQPKGDS